MRNQFAEWMLGSIVSNQDGRGKGQCGVSDGVGEEKPLEWGEPVRGSQMSEGLG